MASGTEGPLRLRFRRVLEQLVDDDRRAGNEVDSSSSRTTAVRCPRCRVLPEGSPSSPLTRALQLPIELPASGQRWFGVRSDCSGGGAPRPCAASAAARCAPARARGGSLVLGQQRRRLGGRRHVVGLLGGPSRCDCSGRSRRARWTSSPVAAALPGRAAGGPRIASTADVVVGPGEVDRRADRGCGVARRRAWRGASVDGGDRGRSAGQSAPWLDVPADSASDRAVRLGDGLPVWTLTGPSRRVQSRSAVGLARLEASGIRRAPPSGSARTVASARHSPMPPIATLDRGSRERWALGLQRSAGNRSTTRALAQRRSSARRGRLRDGDRDRQAERLGPRTQPLRDRDARWWLEADPRRKSLRRGERPGHASRTRGSPKVPQLAKIAGGKAVLSAADNGPAVKAVQRGAHRPQVRDGPARPRRLVRQRDPRGDRALPAAARDGPATSCRQGPRRAS